MLNSTIPIILSTVQSTSSWTVVNRLGKPDIFTSGWFKKGALTVLHLLQYSPPKKNTPVEIWFIGGKIVNDNTYVI